MTEAKRHVLITAGGSGIGLVMAQTFLAAGDIVAVTDSDADTLNTAQQQVPALQVFHADCTDEQRMEAVYDELQRDWGGLDILIANAGIAGPTATIDDIRLADWRQCLAVNLDGAFLACRRAAVMMKAQQRGLIILLSSTAGLFGYPYRAPYAAAKWAIIGLCKTLAMELGPYNVRANVICPGAVEGKRMAGVIQREAEARGITEAELRAGYESCVSLRSFVTPEDIANTALFLASPAARHISGVALPVDGHTEKVSL